MTARLILLAAAVFGMLGVALGAFGAHGYKRYLEVTLKAADSAQRLTTYETAVRYQFYHALALLAVALLRLVRPELPGLGTVAWLFVGGILLFSGSLYLLSFTGIKWFGPVTPVGGLLFLAGWGLLIVAALRLP
jgi:uncharacterized membrane protein YgdD (TMEM256/DUF423 family)